MSSLLFAWSQTMQRTLSPPWLERANHLALAARLLAGAVHDVNNLLQVISGQADAEGSERLGVGGPIIAVGRPTPNQCR